MIRQYRFNPPKKPTNRGRRHFLTLALSVAALALLRKLDFPKERSLSDKPVSRRENHLTDSGATGISINTSPVGMNLGVSRGGLSDVYLARGETPEHNMRNIIKMLGGISSIIDKDDIVVLKPNAQWWYQGTTNTDAMHAFIQAVLSIPGFRGEIIIAENHQYAIADSRGWNTTKRNGRYNLNELVAHFNAAGHRNVTKYHWQCAGPNPRPLQGSASSAARIVKGPEDGDGYVWNHELVYISPLGRKCLLTYPIFTSAYSGVTIDFKNGAWKNGKYTEQSLKFINFSALNHHSEYSGVTASVKNYMGIVDMTCGFQGTIPKDHWNTHFIGIRDDFAPPLYKYIPWRIKIKIDGLYKMKYFYHTGGVIGSFMREIRMADLNIITAHWVGYGSRTDTNKSGYSKAILAGKDPVALDYIAGREVLSPLTREKAPNNKWLNRINDVTDKQGPFHKFLTACYQQGIGNIEPDKMRVVSM